MSPPKRLLAIGVAIAGAVLLPAAGWFVFARHRVEQPRFELVERGPHFELRRYAPRIVAEVEVEGDPETASNEGFRILAAFIFGKNRDADGISMTSPVSRQTSTPIAMTSPVDRRGSEERWTITFTMPSEYDLGTLPRPEDPRITIREVSAATFAAVRFSGAPDERQVQERIDELSRQLRAAGLSAKSEPVFARYDPPWTPGFLRRNEILVEVEPTAPPGA